MGGVPNSSSTASRLAGVVAFPLNFGGALLHESTPEVFRGSVLVELSATRPVRLGALETDYEDRLV